MIRDLDLAVARVDNFYVLLLPIELAAMTVIPVQVADKALLKRHVNPPLQHHHRHQLFLTLLQTQPLHLLQLLLFKRPLHLLQLLLFKRPLHLFQLQ